MVLEQSASNVVRHIQSGHRVFVHGSAATPMGLIDALVEQADRLTGVELMHLHPLGPTPMPSRS